MAARLARMDMVRNSGGTYEEGYDDDIENEPAQSKE